MKLSPKQKAAFGEYTRDAAAARHHLEFLLDNLGQKVALDYSVESMRLLEQAFWNARVSGVPADLSDQEHFLRLMGQYLGEAIIQHTGARWTQGTESNPRFGQPCVDGFGNEKWDRIYPVALSNAYESLARTNPGFPGVADHTVFARLLEKALQIHGSAAAARR